LKKLKTLDHLIRANSQKVKKRLSLDPLGVS
jgi:hypothetical protein